VEHHVNEEEGRFFENAEKALGEVEFHNIMKQFQQERLERIRVVS
jgi:hypothetical protein